MFIDGIVSPGGSVGTLDIVGELELGDDAQYVCELEAGGNDVITATTHI